MTARTQIDRDAMWTPERCPVCNLPDPPNNPYCFCKPEDRMAVFGPAYAAELAATIAAAQAARSTWLEAAEMAEARAADAQAEWAACAGKGEYAAQRAEINEELMCLAAAYRAKAEGATDTATSAPATPESPVGGVPGSGR